MLANCAVQNFSRSNFLVRKSFFWALCTAGVCCYSYNVTISISITNKGFNENYGISKQIYFLFQTLL